MSEYQRYEFMTIDRPLTGAELAAVNNLSSHIQASSSHALIEYHWGNFKHNPIDVLHKFFDGFLYWANWGSPILAFRFPHGILPANLIEGYNFDDFITFTQHRQYDILKIHFSELESSGEWIEHQLGSLISIREELMGGDRRALYIVWLASQYVFDDYDNTVDDDDDTDDDDDDTDDDDDDTDDDETAQGHDTASKTTKDLDDDDETEYTVPRVPPDFDKLTEAQQALAELLQVPEELLVAAAQHSQAAEPATKDNFAVWLTLLSPERRDEYLLRLARNESGLSRLLVRELRELGLSKLKAMPAAGERVVYARLLAESQAAKARMEQEQRELAQQAHRRRLQEVHERQAELWQQIEQTVVRSSSSGYDEAVRILVELREAAATFDETTSFLEHFRIWVQQYQRRPALLKRLQDHNFPMS